MIVFDSGDVYGVIVDESISLGPCRFFESAVVDLCVKDLGECVCSSVFIVIVSYFALFSLSPYSQFGFHRSFSFDVSDVKDSSDSLCSSADSSGVMGSISGEYMSSPGLYSYLFRKVLYCQLVSAASNPSGILFRFFEKKEVFTFSFSFSAGLKRFGSPCMILAFSPDDVISIEQLLVVGDAVSVGMLSIVMLIGLKFSGEYISSVFISVVVSNDMSGKFTSDISRGWKSPGEYAC